jgi:hypothetical protein
MAHFAQLNNSSAVTRVVVINNDALGNLPFPESEPVGIAFCQSLFGSDTIWKQTSYNASFRKNYAEIDGVYDSILDAFICLQPYPSWLLNTTTCKWVAPIPKPNDGQQWGWDEKTLSWVVIPPPPKGE